MSEFPLAQDDKGNVLGFDGERWRPPDDIAVNDKGQRAFRFGQSWQIESEKPARNVSPAGEANRNDWADTAALTAGAFQKGARSGGNPLNLLGGLASVGEAMTSHLPVQSAAFKALGIAPDEVSKFAARNAPSMDPVRYWDANPMTRAAGQAMYGYDPATALKDTESAYKATGAEKTPTRDFLTGAAEIVGEQLPYLATGPVKAGLALTGASGALAGAGNVFAGDEGKRAGSLLALGIPVGVTAARGLYRNTVPPFTDKGVQGLADRAILEASGETAQGLASKIKSPALPGVPATLGQRTGNRGLLDAEYALHGKTPLVEDSYRTTARMAGDEMSALAGKSERAASEGLRGELTKIYRQEKAMVTPDIERVKEGIKSFSVKSDALNKNVDAYTSNLSQARQKWLNDAGLGDIRSLAKGDKVALNEIDDVLAAMKAKVRDMPAGSPEKLEVGKFVAHMQGGMEKIVPGMGTAYRQYAQFKGDFDNNKLIGSLFKRNPDRTFKIPASEIGDAIRRMPAEAIERAAKLSPGVQRAMRDWVAAAWREKSVTANAGTRAADAPNLAGALKFRQDNDVLFRAAFSKADLERADKIVDALKGPTLAEYGQRRFGSPTYNKFQKGTLIEGLVGRLLGQVPGGGMVNQALGNWIMSKPIAQLEAAVTDALLNPDKTIARLLTLKATPGNARMLNPYLRALPAPIAGAVSAQ